MQENNNRYPTYEDLVARLDGKTNIEEIGQIFFDVFNERCNIHHREQDDRNIIDRLIDAETLKIQKEISCYCKKKKIDWFNELMIHGRVTTLRTEQLRRLNDRLFAEMVAFCSNDQKDKKTEYSDNPQDIENYNQNNNKEEWIIVEQKEKHQDSKMTNKEKNKNERKISPKKILQKKYNNIKKVNKKPNRSKQKTINLAEEYKNRWKFLNNQYQFRDFGLNSGFKI